MAHIGAGRGRGPMAGAADRRNVGQGMPEQAHMRLPGPCAARLPAWGPPPTGQDGGGPHPADGGGGGVGDAKGRGSAPGKAAGAQPDGGSGGGGGMPGVPPAAHARSPLRVRSVDGQGAIVFKISEMDEGVLYPVAWKGDRYALRLSDQNVEMFRLEPTCRAPPDRSA